MSWSDGRVSAGDFFDSQRVDPLIGGAIEFHECARITNAGVALLAGLPQLREIAVGGSPKVTRDGMAVFPITVRANYW